MQTLPCPVLAARSLLIFCFLLFAGIDVACAEPQPQKTSRSDGDWLSDILRIMRGASDYDSLLAQKWMHEWIGEQYRVHNSAAAQSSHKKLWPVIVSNVEPGTIRQQALTDYALLGPLDKKAVIAILKISTDKGEHQGLRHEAIAALSRHAAQTRNQKLAATFFAVARDETESPQIRSSALAACLLPHVKEQALSLVLEILNDSTAHVDLRINATSACGAATLLSPRRGDEVAATLLAVAVGDNGLHLRVAALNASSGIALRGRVVRPTNDMAMRLLAILLNPQEDQRIRKGAGTALWSCDFQAPVLAGPLTAALQSPEPFVQESVIRAIRSLRGNTKAAIPELERILLNDDTPENVRIEAAETIRDIAPVEAARLGIAVPPDQ